MPATYTYNDAIEDATRIVAHTWDKQPYPETHMKLMLEIIGELGNLRRPSRRKRSKEIAPHPASAGQ